MPMMPPMILMERICKEDEFVLNLPVTLVIAVEAVVVVAAAAVVADSVEEEVVVAEEVAKEELELAEVVGTGCWLILMTLVWW